MSSWLPILRRRGVSVLFQSYINHGYKDEYYQEILGVSHGLGSHRYVDGWVIIHTDEAETFTSQFIPRLDEPDYVKYFLRQCTDVADALLATGRAIRAKTYDANDIADVLFDFMTFSSRTIRVMPFLNTMVFVQDTIEARLRAMLSRCYDLEADDHELGSRLQNLMGEGTRIPLASRAMTTLSQFAREISAAHPDLAERLRTEAQDVRHTEVVARAPDLARRLAQYLDDYDFLSTNYYLGNPTSLSELYSQLGGFMQSSAERTGQASPPIGAERELDDSQRELVETAQRLQYLREYRLEALYKAGRDCRELLACIGEVLGTSYDETLHLTFSEIQASLTASAVAVDLELVSERMVEYASCVEHDQPEIVTGEALETLRAQLPARGEPGNVLSGVTAFPGESVGPACIVTELEQANDLRAGDVLVAPMTMPYHVPAMARSGAVLTDEGGVLSHAAIVARELQIPCIVGLGSATSAFRDGDRLRVLANPSSGRVERVNN